MILSTASLYAIVQYSFQPCCVRAVDQWITVLKIGMQFKIAAPLLEGQKQYYLWINDIRIGPFFISLLMLPNPLNSSSNLFFVAQDFNIWNSCGSNYLLQVRM